MDFNSLRGTKCMDQRALAIKDWLVTCKNQRQGQGTFSSIIKRCVCGSESAGYQGLTCNVSESAARDCVCVDQRVHGKQRERGKSEWPFLTVDVRGVRTVGKSDSSAMVYSLCFTRYAAQSPFVLALTFRTVAKFNNRNKRKSTENGNRNERGRIKR